MKVPGHYDIDCSNAAKFRVGQKPVVKDFFGLEEPAQSMDFTVVRLTPARVYLIDADGKELQLKRRMSHRWEWAFHEPSVLITPVATQ